LQRIDIPKIINAAIVRPLDSPTFVFWVVAIATYLPQ